MPPLPLIGRGTPKPAIHQCAAVRGYVLMGNAQLRITDIAALLRDVLTSFFSPEG